MRSLFVVALRKPYSTTPAGNNLCCYLSHPPEFEKNKPLLLARNSSVLQYDIMPICVSLSPGTVLRINQDSVSSQNHTLLHWSAVDKVIWNLETILPRFAMIFLCDSFREDCGALRPLSFSTRWSQTWNYFRRVIGINLLAGGRMLERR